MDSYLKKIGFKRSKADNCLYYRGHGESLFLIVLYVDDILLISKDNKDIKQVQKELKMQFDMKDLGDAEFIVGMKVERDWSKKTI